MKYGVGVLLQTWSFLDYVILSISSPILTIDEPENMFET